MLHYFRRKILFLSDHPMSFGDSLTSISRFDSYINSTDLVHYCVHPTTLSCISWYLNNHVQCDKIVQNYNHNLYDIVVLENYYNMKHLNVPPYKLYRGISCSDQSIDLFGKPEIKATPKKDRLHQIKSLPNKDCNKKSLCLFPFSTRPLSNINPDGINKIVSLFEDYKIYLCGEMYNTYTDNINSVLSKSLSRTNLDKINDNVINLLGLGTRYTIELCNNSDLVVMAPTGIGMLGILGLIKTKTLILNCGDTDVIHAIYKNYPKMENIEFIKTNCPLFPCGNSNEAKALECKNNKIAACLNKELECKLTTI